jgi:single-strand DNA-binding protein
MVDTYVTIVGNVMTAPEWRRTTQTNSLVANFKVASTARRLNRESGQWVDGNSLRLRVNCWRKLAEGVAASIMVGDPVIVVGRLYTRDWIDGEGNNRTLYEMEAVAVGHDLARGRGRFARNRPTLATSSLEDPEAESRVRGEATEEVPEEDAPSRFGDHPFDDLSDPDFQHAPISPAPAYDALAAIRGVGFGPSLDGDDDLAPVSDDDSDDSSTDSDGDEESAGDEAAAIGFDGEESAGGSVRRRRGRGREAVPA